MIRVTNNTREFIEKHTGRIVIYGAGNAGYWVGYYMNRCGIEFECYINSVIDHENSLYNDKPIFQIDRLNEYKDEELRIIVTPTNFESVLTDLLWFDHLYELNAYCLIPKYINITSGDEIYHINKMLAYFRGKLFKGDTPTILCNSCLAGRIYEYIDRPMLSPTINVGISPDDFIKLCKSPQHYLGIEMKELHWVRPFGNPGRKIDMPCGKLDDIEIVFAHTDSEEGIVERWNMMRERINWDRIIYLLTEQSNQDNIPFSVLNSFFDEIDGEKLFVNTHNYVPCGRPYEQVYMPTLYFIKYDSVIENYFDLLGWINREYI